MKKQCSEKESDETEIRYREISGKTIRYGFVERRTESGNFGISIEYDDVYETYDIGDDFSCAARLYDMMTRGLVTHITASYVIEDFFSDK